MYPDLCVYFLPINALCITDTGFSCLLVLLSFAVAVVVASGLPCVMEVEGGTDIEVGSVVDVWLLGRWWLLHHRVHIHPPTNLISY